MNLLSALKARYPTFDPLIDVPQNIAIAADAEGSYYIASWNVEKFGPKPDIAVLIAEAEAAPPLAEDTRIAGLLADPDMQALLTRLRTSTAAEIKTWVAQQIADLPTRAMLTRVVLLLAFLVRWIR